MILMILLIVFAATTAMAQSTESDAQRLIGARKFAAARGVYENLSAASPENKGFALWVARLSSWLGEFDRAIKIYDDVLRVDPANREALIGKSTVLMWQQKYGKARAVIEEAEKLDRYDIGLLIAKINYYRYQRKFPEARETLRIAREISPENPELRELGQKLESSRSFEYKAGCEQSFEPFTATVTACFANVAYERGADRIVAGVQAGNRFGTFYREFNVNWNRMLDRRLSVNAGIGLEPTRETNIDVNLSANYKITDRFQAGANLRLWRFRKDLIRIFSTSASYSISRQTQIQTTFYATSSPVILLRANQRVGDRLTLGASYVQTFKSIRGGVAGFTQTAFAASGKYQITKNLSVSGSYGFSRKGSEPAHSIYGFGFTVTK